VAATAIDESNAKLRELARVARPLLQRIAAPEPLSRKEVDRCVRQAHQLRDHLRGIGLVHPLVDPAAEAARRRGVKVVMFDDDGMNEVEEEIRHRVLRTIAEELDRARNGSIAVRIVPPGRMKLATVVAHSDTNVRRVEFDLAGRPTVLE
jgi:hypothetical protein